MGQLPSKNDTGRIDNANRITERQATDFVRQRAKEIKQGNQNRSKVLSHEKILDKYIDRKIQERCNTNKGAYSSDVTLDVARMRELEGNPVFKRNVVSYISSNSEATKLYLKILNPEIKSYLHTKINERKHEQENTQYVMQHKEVMKNVFRNGGKIQLLNEEKFTLSTIERTLQHPKLAEKLAHLINVDDLPGLKEADKPQAQTAIAFKYANLYKEHKGLIDKGANYSPEISYHDNFSTQAGEKALEDLSKVRDIVVKKAENDLFCNRNNSEINM